LVGTTTAPLAGFGYKEASEASRLTTPEVDEFQKARPN
jgi:hypothetical protein